MTHFKKVSTDAATRNTLSRMERDWDARAREAPEHYIASAHCRWRMDEFFQSGEINVDNYVLADAEVMWGKKPSQMRVLEIGCGAGRMTRALAASFREVHAVDISTEMVALAKRNLSDLRNVFLYKNNGIDLLELPDQSFDFAFSFIVFQHIPILRIIENYVREVHRCLKPGSVFKFQVQGDTGIHQPRNDTWAGVPISVADARTLANHCGFEMIGASGQDSQYFWLWFLKPKWSWLPKVIRNNAAKALTRVRCMIVSGRFWCAKQIAVVFSPQSVRAGEACHVCVPRFAGEVIDVGYELTTERCPAPMTGVVGKWCELDSRGEARILVPAEHPTGLVRITKVRSRTKNSRWYPAGGAIQVAGAEELLARLSTGIASGEQDPPARTPPPIT